MNLRQKNKKLKQELERLKIQTIPVNIKVQQHPIIVHRPVRQCSQFEYAMCDLGIVKKNLVRDLVERAMPYVIFNQRFDPVTGNVIIQADLSVVDMRKES